LRARIFFFFREGEEDVDTFLVTIFFILAGAFSFRNDNLFDLSIENVDYKNFSNFSEFFYFFKNANFFKWFFDLIYIKILVNLFYRFSNFLFINFDRGVFEIFGPLGFVRFFRRLCEFLINFQTGFLYHYILFQIVNLIGFYIYMNNFLYESKVFIFFFLSIFGFFRFFLTSNFFVKESKVLLPQRLTDINNKRFYGTARNRNKARRGRSDKRFDARRNMHFKDLDAFGPKRPKMSILSQFFFIIGQCFMNIIWLSSDLVRCFFFTNRVSFIYRILCFFIFYI